MTSYTSMILHSIPEADLITPTSARKYPLGARFITQDVDDPAAVKGYIYVKSHGTLTVNVPYVVTYSGTAGSEVKTSTPVTLAVAAGLVVVPQVAVTSGYYAWVQYLGACECVHTAETYAASDFLQLLSAGVTLAVDGSTGSTVLTENSCAITIDAGTTAVAKTVMLIGDKCGIAAT